LLRARDVPSLDIFINSFSAEETRRDETSMPAMQQIADWLK
jgi:hypothetical protein